MPANMSKDDSDLTIIAGNLALADIKQSALFEIRLAHLRELARAVISQTTPKNQRGSRRDLWEAELIRERLSHALSPQSQREEGTLKSNAPILDSLYDKLDVLSKVHLCRELLKALENQTGTLLDPYNFFEPDDPLDKSAPGCIAYVQNAYTDTTYTAASACIKTPSASYAQSYDLSCDEVYTGRCEFCILPIENTVDGMLLGFYTLIDKYDLKIALAFNVSGADGSTVTKFALCSRSLSREMPISPLKTEHTFFEIRILPGNGLSLSDIMTAADALGLTLRRIDSIPLSYTENAFAHNIVFCTDRADLTCFLAFMSIWSPYYLTIGYYKEYLGYTIPE